MHLVSRLPRVIGIWEAFPMEEILQGAVTPEVAMVSNGLDFIFLFTLDQLWGWPRVVCAVFLRLPIWV